MVRVITYGTYDLLHYGHIRLLKRAKALGDYLIVGVTTDDYDKTRGKINNQQTLMERVAAVEATGLADEVIVEEYEGQKIDDIKRFDIDIFTVGSDWEGKFDYLNEFCKVIYLPRTEGISSTDIRSANRNMRLSIVGDLSIARKFSDECRYVNGVEVVDGELSMNEFDAACIVSRPEHHYDDVRRMLVAGKHVLCQSPIAIEKAQCEELLELAKQRDLVLMDGIKTAYATAYCRLVLLLKSGKIGNVISVDATCTSLLNTVVKHEDVERSKINSICAWGPTALLPVFQILGTNYREKLIITHILDEKKRYDGFTKIDFIFDTAVASVKVAKAAKSEGEMIVTGTQGYIFVPAPWWKTDYFEVRYEDPTCNRRYYYQLDGEGIRYEIAAFVNAVGKGKHTSNISEDVTRAICTVIGDYYRGDCVEI